MDLVGFVLNCWINARICGLIVADLCFVLQTLEKSFHCKCFTKINRVSKTQFPGGRHVEKHQLRSN